MSLNLTLLNQYGVWQCSDHRIIDLISRKIIDDSSLKHLPMLCTDGHLLLAYAGIGTMRAARSLIEVPLAQWLREFLRGTPRTMAETIEVIRMRATTDLGRPLAQAGCRHMFTVGCFVANQPWLIQIANFERHTNAPLGPAVPTFTTVSRAISAMGYSSVLAGWPYDSLVLKYGGKYEEALDREPRDPDDFSNLLAELNQRIARHLGPRGPISEHCTVTYTPPAGLPWRLKSYFLPRGMTQPAMRYLSLGFDLCELVYENHALLVKGIVPSEERTAELADKAVRPRNLLAP